MGQIQSIPYIFFYAAGQFTGLQGGVDSKQSCATGQTTCGGASAPTALLTGTTVRPGQSGGVSSRAPEQARVPSAVLTSRRPRASIELRDPCEQDYSIVLDWKNSSMTKPCLSLLGTFQDQGVPLPGMPLGIYTLRVTPENRCSARLR